MLLMLLNKGLKRWLSVSLPMVLKSIGSLLNTHSSILLARYLNWWDLCSSYSPCWTRLRQWVASCYWDGDSPDLKTQMGSIVFENQIVVFLTSFFICGLCFPATLKPYSTAQQSALGTVFPPWVKLVEHSDCSSTSCEIPNCNLAPYWGEIEDKLVWLYVLSKMH